MALTLKFGELLKKGLQNPGTGFSVCWPIVKDIMENTISQIKSCRG